MTLTADFIDAMLASGIPAEQVLAAVRGLLVRDQERKAEAEEARLEAQRESNRLRQARFYDRHHRKSNGSNGVRAVKTREDREAPKSSPTPPKTTPQEDLPSDPIGSSAPSGADGRACRIPDDFEHWPEAEQAVIDAGFDRQEAAELIAEFVDYWRPLPKGAKAMKTDWLATFRNRLREVRRRRPQVRQRPISNGRSNPFYDIAREASEDHHGSGSDASEFRPRLIAGARH